MTRRKHFAATVASLAIVAVLSAQAALAAPPANDNFANAVQIDLNALPFSSEVNINEATTEAFEQMYCTFSTQTIWYQFTTSAQVWLGIDALGSTLFGTSITLYRAFAPGLDGLSFVTCVGETLGFHANAGATYYVQLKAPCCGSVGVLHLNVQQIPTPPPVANFYYSPFDPSTFDNVQFYDSSYDQGEVGITTRAWDFGDGGTSTDYNPTHRYVADGDYTVKLTVGTSDGRTDDVTQPVSVRTHDVAITKFRVPTSGVTGQTRTLTVGIKNSRYPENVRLEFFKSQPGGYQNFQSIGVVVQPVPVRTGNRTTDVSMLYTFTADDASIGKLTFKAVAYLVSARDALPGDNEAVSAPTKVSRYDGSGEITSGESVTGADAQLALLRATSAAGDLLVELSLPNDGAATLQVFDVAGRMMADHKLGSLGTGIHETKIAFERPPAPGNYWIRLTHNGNSVSRKVTVLR